MTHAGKIISDLCSFATDERKKTNEWFFKTGKGQYGEGDKFIGVSMPHIRKVAKTNTQTSLKELEILLYDKIHEVRLCSLVILVNQYKKASFENKKELLKFYLKHKAQINNWDLVDVSAHYILGQAILDGIEKRATLFELIQSKSLWDRRISIVSTWIMIRSGEIETTLQLSKKLLKDPEDLMHKAVGWMLREAWKKDSENIENFLMENYTDLPRTTLRYAIERMEETKRKQFLKGEFSTQK